MSDDLPNPFEGAASKKELDEFLGPPEPENETPEEKYARLKKREQDLLEKQKQLQDGKAGPAQAPNWPSFLPMLYYNPESDIPPSARTAVKSSLYGFCTICVNLVINIIAIISVRGLEKYNYASNLIFAIIEGLFTLYFSLEFCYKKLYKSCATHDIPFLWTIYQFILLAWLLYMFIGFPTSGFAGFATFLDLVAKSDSVWAKLISFVNTAIDVVSVFFEVRVLFLAQKYQKISGIEEPMVTPEVSSFETPTTL